MATPPEALPLRWGTYRARVAGGGILIVSGAVAIAGFDEVAPWLLPAGLIAHVAGWCVMPSAGWRRVVAVVLSTPAALLLLTGPKFVAVLVLAYIAWMLVRHRPARSFPTVIFVLAGAAILPRLYPDYDGMLPALGIEFAIMLASGWVAGALARNGAGDVGSRHPPREPS